MKGFTPTAASNGFSHDLLWSGLRSGCRAPSALRIMIGLHSSSQQPGIDEVNFWQLKLARGRAMVTD